MPSTAISQEPVGKVTSSGSTFRIELSSVGGKPFCTGVQPDLYATAKVSYGEYILATAHPDLRKCVVEPVQTVPGSTALSPSQIESAACVPFRPSEATEILVEEKEEGLITSVHLVADTLVASLTKNGRSTSQGPLVKHLHIHLFIGTSYGSLIVCDALRGTTLAVCRFIGWKAEAQLSPVRSGADMVFHGKSVSEGGDGSRAAAGVASGTSRDHGVAVVSCVPCHQFESPSDLTKSFSKGLEPSLMCVYVVHQNGSVVALERDSLDVLITAAKKLGDVQRKAQPPSRLSLLEWRPSESTMPFPAVGPAASFVNHIKHIYETDTFVPHWRKAASSTVVPRRMILGAGVFEYTIVNSEDAAKKGRIDRYSALMLCGSFPTYSINLVSNKDAAFSLAKAVKAVSSAKTYASRVLKSWLTLSQQPVQETVETVKLETERFFMDEGIVVTAVDIDPSQQWAALYAREAERLYIVELGSGCIVRVLRRGGAVQFQWVIVPTLHQEKLFLVVIEASRQLVELHDLHHTTRVAAATIPSEAILLPAVSTVEKRSHRDVLWLLPSGAVHRMVIDADALSLSCLAETSSGGHYHGRDEGPREVMQPAAPDSSSALSNCITPGDFLDAAMSIPLPQSTPYGTGEQFTAYVRKLREVCEWVEARFSPGLSATRKISFIGQVPQRIPHTVTAAQVLNFLRQRCKLVDGYRELLSPPPNYSEQDVALSLAPSQTMLALVEDVIPEALQDKPMVATAEPSVDRDRGSAFWRKAFNSVDQHLLGEADCAALWQLYHRLFETPETPIQPMPQSPVIDLGYFQQYFYCGDTSLVFLKKGIELQEALSPSLDVYADLGSLVFGLYGLPVTAYQLRPLLSLGLVLEDVAMIFVAWWVRMSSIGKDSRSACSSCRMDAFFSTVLLFDGSVLAAAVKCIALHLVGSSDQVAASQSRLEALLLVCTVHCGFSTQQGQDNPLFLTLCRVLRIWSLIQNHRSLLVCEREDVRPLQLSHLQQSVPFSGVPSTVTIEEYLLEAIGPRRLTSDAMLQMQACLTVSDSDSPSLDSTARDSHFAKGASAHLNYLAFSQLLQHCGVPKVFSAFQPLRAAGLETSTGDNVYSTPWYQDGEWDAQLFEEHVHMPLLEQWNAILAEGSQHRQFDQCCFFVGLLGLIEEMLSSLHHRLYAFWESSMLPPSNFLGCTVGGSSRVKSLYLCDEAATNAFLDGLCGLLLFFLNVYQDMGMDDESVQLCVSKTLSVYIVNEEKCVFTVVPSGLRDRLCDLLSMVGASPSAVRLLVEDWMDIIRLLRLFMKFSELTIDGITIPVCVDGRFPWVTLYGSLERLQAFDSYALTQTSMARSASRLDNIPFAVYVVRIFLTRSLLFSLEQRTVSANGVHAAQSPEIQAVVDEMCTALGVPESVAPLFIVDYHLKSFLDGSFVEKQLQSQRNNRCCAFFVAQHFRILINICYRLYKDKVQLLPATTASRLSRASKLLDVKMSRSLVGWLEKDVNPSPATTQQRSDSADMNWFSEDELKEYRAAVEQYIRSDSTEKSQYLKALIVEFRDFLCEENHDGVLPQEGLSGLVVICSFVAMVL